MDCETKSALFINATNYGDPQPVEYPVFRFLCGEVEVGADVGDEVVRIPLTMRTQKA